jgi:carbonic anhydrase/acetyltransferase-like protein (isoleucine patch superfamily)
MIYEFKGFIPVIHESSFIHPQAAVTGNVIIGKDVYVGPVRRFAAIGVRL